MAKSMMAMLAVVKQMASDADGLNTRCYRGLVELLNRDREDIIINIKKLMQAQADKYTPDLFADYFDDIDALITRYDKMYNSKALKNEYSLQEYEEKKIAYDLGESDENPDL